MTKQQKIQHCEDILKRIFQKDVISSFDLSLSQSVLLEWKLLTNHKEDKTPVLK